MDLSELKHLRKKGKGAEDEPALVSMARKVVVGETEA